MATMTQRAIRPNLPWEILLFVSTTGNDTTGTGTRTAPYATFDKARQEVRKLLLKQRTGGETYRPIRVYFEDGTYYLPSTLAFDYLDGGMSSGTPVTYCPINKGKVIISGGRQLSYVNTQGNGAYRYNAVSAALADIASPSQLYVDGQRATLARFPKSGSYGYIRKAINTAGEATAKTNQFLPDPSMVSALAALSGPASDTGSDLYRVIINLYSSWTTFKMRYSTTAPTIAGAIRLSAPAKQPFLSAGGSTQRFYVENVPQHMTASGEWVQNGAFIDYLPVVGNSTISSAVLAYLPRLMTFSGYASDINVVSVENINFDHLSFQHQASQLTYIKNPTTAPVTTLYYVDTQAAIGDSATTWGDEPVGAAMTLSYCKNVNFRYCEFKHTGGWGVWKKKFTQFCNVYKCVFSDMGAGSVRIGTETTATSVTNSSGISFNTVSNNWVYDIGKVYPGAVGVLIQKAYQNKIFNNTICYTPYSGISVGWDWTMAEPSSAENQIYYNRFYNIGMKQMADGAAIYSLGMSHGTLFYRNLIQECRGYPNYGPQDFGVAGIMGIYFDESSSYIGARENVICGTDGSSVFLHYGVNVTVKDNLLLDGTGGVHIGLINDKTTVKAVLSQGAFVPGIAITSATWASGYIVANCASAHTLVSGNKVTLRGFTPAAWNVSSAMVCPQNSTNTATTGGTTLVIACPNDPGAVTVYGGTASRISYTLQSYNSTNLTYATFTRHNLRIGQTLKLYNQVNATTQVNGDLQLIDVTNNSIVVPMASDPGAITTVGLIKHYSSMVFNGNYAMPNTTAMFYGNTATSMVTYADNLVSSGLAAGVVITAGASGTTASTGTLSTTTVPGGITLTGAPGVANTILANVKAVAVTDETDIAAEFLANVPRVITKTYPAPAVIPEYDFYVDNSDITVIPGELAYYADTVNGTPAAGAFTSISVVSQQAANPILTSGYALQVSDTGTYAIYFEPYAQVTALNRTSGQVVVRFNAKVGPAAIFEFNIRNKTVNGSFKNHCAITLGGSGAALNPSSIKENTPGGLVTQVASITDNTWYGFTITIPNVADGNHTTTITNAAGTVLYSGSVVSANAGAENVDGIYLISAGTGAASTWTIADISVKRT